MMIYIIKRISSWLNVKIVVIYLIRLKNMKILNIVAVVENIIKNVKYVEKKFLCKPEHVIKNVRMS